MFSTKKLKDISDQVYHTGKCSDYESDDSVHYSLVHNLLLRQKMFIK